MVDDGRMRHALEQLREPWEARGIVEYVAEPAGYAAPR